MARPILQMLPIWARPREAKRQAAHAIWPGNGARTARTSGNLVGLDRMTFWLGRAGRATVLGQFAGSLPSSLTRSSCTWEGSWDWAAQDVVHVRGWKGEQSLEHSEANPCCTHAMCMCCAETNNS